MPTLTPEEPPKSLVVDWTQAKLDRLKLLYKRAQLSHQDCLIVEGHLILTDSAKHLIEHVETVTLPRKGIK